MNISNEIIDLTKSFSLTKVYSTTDVIDLLDTDDSFNSSVVTVIERNNNSEQETGPCKKKSRHQQKHILAKESSKQETKKVTKRKLNCWGDCPICWDELGRNPLASTKCGHVYCLKCLEQSLKIEKRCPTCRRVLKGPCHTGGSQAFTKRSVHATNTLRVRGEDVAAAHDFAAEFECIVLLSLVAKTLHIRDVYAAWPLRFENVCNPPVWHGP